MASLLCNVLLTSTLPDLRESIQFAIVVYSHSKETLKGCAAKMTLVSPLQAEDGRLGGDLSEQTTASALWDVLVDQASGFTLDEIVDLAALPKDACEVVCIARARLLMPSSPCMRMCAL